MKAAAIKMVFTIIISGILSACANQPITANNNYGVPVLNRTLPERMIDEGIEHTLIKNLPNVAGLENMNERTLRVVADSFRGEVLLTGEVPNAEVKAGITKMAESMRDVKKVYNYLTVNSTAKSPSHTAHENFLKSKIRAKITLHGSKANSQYKMTVRSDVVYLMGYLTPVQQGQIIEAIEDTMGMEKVVLLATLVTDNGEELNASDIMSDNSPNDMVAHAPEQKMYGATTVRMQETPTSSYVQLYNGTANP